jgi:high frequency lysogenization protein
MTYTLSDRTIALAAVFQAARLVHQVASTGNVDQTDLETSLRSLFKVDVEQAEDAFNGADNLATGFHTLIEQLGGRGQPGWGGHTRDLSITKYVAGILVLERRLMKDPAMLQAIRDGIARAQTQAEHFSLTHDNVVASLAHLYTQTISTLKPRIMVQGEHVYLANDTNANRIRALLLAAIRAAVLWRQCGGNRWQLFFQRKAVLEEARRLQKRA